MHKPDQHTAAAIRPQHPGHYLRQLFLQLHKPDWTQSDQLGGVEIVGTESSPGWDGLLLQLHQPERLCLDPGRMEVIRARPFGKMRQHPYLMIL